MVMSPKTSVPLDRVVGRCADEGIGRETGEGGACPAWPACEGCAERRRRMEGGDWAAAMLLMLLLWWWSIRAAARHALLIVVYGSMNVVSGDADAIEVWPSRSVLIQSKTGSRT